MDRCGIVVDRCGSFRVLVTTKANREIPKRKSIRSKIMKSKAFLD